MQGKNAPRAIIYRYACNLNVVYFNLTGNEGQAFVHDFYAVGHLYSAFLTAFQRHVFVCIRVYIWAEASYSSESTRNAFLSCQKYMYTRVYVQLVLHRLLLQLMASHPSTILLPSPSPYSTLSFHLLLYDNKSSSDSYIYNWINAFGSSKGRYFWPILTPLPLSHFVTHPKTPKKVRHTSRPPDF